MQEALAVHVLVIVVDHRLSLPERIEAISHALQRMPDRTRVRQAQEGLRTVHRRNAALADLEALHIPVGKAQLLLQALHVQIKVGDGDRTPGEEAAREHPRGADVLLNQLVIWLQHVLEDLSDTPGPLHGDVPAARRPPSPFGGRLAAERAQAAHEELHPRKRHQIGRDFIQVHIQVAGESHGACEVTDYAAGQIIHPSEALRLVGIRRPVSLHDSGQRSILQG
mmetsp:Transcript_5741/g.22502  ORF Transcript_5741/g.22502 Transcript_5741/m.22502 type:complete len:224 (-) Transcript_5741:652-1323(-)